MILFVNAKINIGLQIVRRREDGYHDLQTLFYPVGLKAGMPADPVEFCDILEICPREAGEPFTLVTTGRAVDCPVEKNLVWRAAGLYMDNCRQEDFSVDIRLDKHLPDGAGMGGGSADAAFTLMMLAHMERGIYGSAPSEAELASMALRLGADCPFFILNRPAYAEGVGERLQETGLDLSGYWLLVVKPPVSVSTREAFSGVIPREADFDLREVVSLPVEKWRGLVRNDFEESIFPLHSCFGEIKAALYASGALYASLTGSGSCLYGIYGDRTSAATAEAELKRKPTISAVYLLEL